MESGSRRGAKFWYEVHGNNGPRGKGKDSYCNFKMPNRRGKNGFVADVIVPS